MTLRYVPLLLALAACGGGGSTLKGTVTVEGGSAANVPVAVYGPVSTVALTTDNGAFTANNLPDGRYLVRATVRGALVEEVSAPVTLSGGKQDVEPVLAFKQKPPPGRLSGRVTVENGSAANVTVFFDGPQSGAATTMADGSFTSSELPDGAYVVRATVRGAEVEDATAATKLVSGRQEGDVTLAFRLPARSQVSGRVVFTDGSDASNLTVVLGGNTFLGARTGAMGAFSFPSVPAGAATVSVEAADTREGRVSVGVAVSGAMVDVGELRLTPVARVGGTVTAGGMPVAGALVRVAGTGAAATTNAAGRFDFVGLPVGDTTFTAETDTQTGTAMARLSRGANTDVMVTVTAPPPPTGTVNGVVGFGTPQAPTLITVSAEGTTVSTRPGVNGAFTLQVPPGVWDITATAPHHPKQLLGRVQVNAGQTVALAGQTLSFFEPIFRAAGPISSLTTLAAASQPWVAVQLVDTLGARALLVNTRTREVRVVAYGTVSFATFSGNARYFAFTLLGQLFSYELSTGQTRLWTSFGPGDQLLYSTDESVMFIQRGTFLERLTLASGQVTRFPPTGVGALYVHTNDRVLVRDQATRDVTLVEPGAATVVFSNAVTLQALPTPIAITGCVPPSNTCSMRVLPPTSRASVAVPGLYPDSPTVLTTSPPDYPLVVFSGSSFVIRASDGTVFPLPANSVGFSFNPTGTRFAYATMGTPTTLREDTLPPSSMPPTPVAQTTGSISFQYYSPTRLLAVDFGVRRIIDVRNGTATVDTDVDPALSPLFAQGMLVWRAPTAMKWRAIVGDEPTADLDAPLTSLPSTIAVRFGMPVTEYGAVAFDSTSTYVVDGRTNTVRRQLGGPLNAAFRSGAVEFFVGTWAGQQVSVNAETGQVLDTDPRRLNSPVTVQSSGARVTLGTQSQDLWLGVF
jgi:hypothetical protein